MRDLTPLLELPPEWSAMLASLQKTAAILAAIHVRLPHEGSMSLAASRGMTDDAAFADLTGRDVSVSLTVRQR